ncbi:MAG: M23 family metallopeptidase [Treponema sp.]|nr:M23 family metallopeptidase [Spirochaetia bacterium]MDD7533914.1 M23 family metallopeptidase [Treponema sp.]MDY3721163.1 M23 family metallopeptidase [Treponema sp.]MDY5757506.1 M23 family metallopeptidase [Treponema sp.]MDY5817995.1 M23 family metallopeptidase [Treponema sp.]
MLKINYETGLSFKRQPRFFNTFFFFLIYFIFSLGNLYAQPDDQIKRIIIEKDKLPVLESLSPSRANTILKDYNNIVESNSKAISAGREPEILFFKYINNERFTFQGLAARCCITQETLATLNQIENAQDDIKGQTLILPVVSGIFIPVERGINSIEILLQENYSSHPLTKTNIYYNINGRDYLFLRSKRFTPTERAYFLDSSLRLPLDNDLFWVSSEFGKRKNPFSGEMKNHNGIDLAAAEGTPVYAIKDGAVYAAIEKDPEFGNYIILSHDLGKMTSVYAHLSKITVDRYQYVKKGDVIGYVGQTGKATGPHLHFEIRTGGKAEDPRIKLNIEK